MNGEACLSFFPHGFFNFNLLALHSFNYPLSDIVHPSVKTINYNHFNDLFNANRSFKNLFHERYPNIQDVKLVRFNGQTDGEDNLLFNFLKKCVNLSFLDIQSSSYSDRFYNELLPSITGLTNSLSQLRLLLDDPHDFKFIHKFKRLHFFTTDLISKEEIIFIIKRLGDASLCQFCDSKHALYLKIFKNNANLFSCDVSSPDRYDKKENLPLDKVIELINDDSIKI